MATGSDIVKDFTAAYEDAFNVMGSIYPAGDKDLRMYLSQQWDGHDEHYGKDKGIPKHTINLIRRTIQALDGYQRRHRLSSVAIPINKEDQATADEYSAVLSYIFQAGDAHTHISDAFKGGLITPINFLNIWMDYSSDPVNGDVKFGVIPYNAVIFSPNFERKDLSDAHFVAIRKWLPPQQAMALCPQFAEEIGLLAKTTEGLDGKFSWLPYAQRPTTFPSYVAYTEYYVTEYREGLKIVDLVSGEMAPWKKSRKEFKALKAHYPWVELMPHTERVIKKHIIVNEHHITTYENQWGLDEYPFVPFFTTYEKAALYYPAKLQSLVRLETDPQLAYSRCFSYMLAMLGNQINSGLIVKEGALVNEQVVKEPGLNKLLVIKSDASMDDVKKIPPGDIPPSFFEILKTLEGLPSFILGLNESSFGVSESGNETAHLMQMRQGASINGTQEIMDNLRYAQKALSIKVLKLARTFTLGRLTRILGHAPSEAFFSPDFLKCHISIQESLLTDTQNQMYFAQLVDLYNLTSRSPGGSPITPMMLVEAAPIQGGSQLREEVRKNMEATAQQAQAQQELEKQYISSTVESNQAGALEKLALAKERLDKEQLNRSLEEERKAKTTRETLLSTLDALKALKEFEGLSEEELLKFYLGFSKLNQQTGGGRTPEVGEEEPVEKWEGHPPSLNQSYLSGEEFR